MNVTEKKKRGFAAMSPEQQRLIASAGGKAAQASGNAHRYTSETAALAGRKGGAIISQNTEHMSRIGKKGGSTTKKRRA